MDLNGKPRVYHVITKLERGGAQKVTLMTLERLPRDQYDVALVTGPEGMLRDWAERIPNLRRYWIPSLIREVRPLKDVTTLWRLWKLFRKDKPTIVHTHSSKAGIVGRWAARLAGVPIIFHTAHGFGFNDFQKRMVRDFYIWLERVTSSITTRSVVVSYANAERGERHGVFSKKDWVLCRDAISVDEFLKPGSWRERLEGWGIDGSKTIVGMIACLKAQKAPVDFVDVAASVLRVRKDVHFVMAGDGELRPEVERRIREHGIGQHLTLLGWVHENEMPEVYRNLDIVVLTSLWEGLPCVFSEAMAVGLPIVATNVDGAREAITHDDNGFLHDPHDITGMAQSVLRLVDDGNLRRTMAERGRARVQEFDISTSVSNLEAAYRECLRQVPSLSSSPSY